VLIFVIGSEKTARKAANSREIREQFSELQTGWRAGHNSNSQSLFWAEMNSNFTTFFGQQFFSRFGFPRKGTAYLPSRENVSIYAIFLHSSAHFGQKKIAKARGIGAFRMESEKQFSALQTVWRRTQSPANPSPSKIPVNREKYREFCSSERLSRVRPLVKTGVNGFRPEIGTGKEQGNNRRHNREKASRNRK
jgi:hypothetical protein